MSSPWPPDRIRIVTPRLVLRCPRVDELDRITDVVLAGIHDADDMPFASDWSILAPDEMRRSRLQRYHQARASWEPDAWDFDLIAFVDDDTPIGGQSVRAKRFPILRGVDSGSWLGRDWQGRGLGREMREAMLHFAFDTLDALSATSEAFDNNAASAAVSRRCGYHDDGEEYYVSQGRRRRTLRFRLDRDDWLTRRRDDIEVCGVTSQARELFGV